MSQLNFFEKVDRNPRDYNVEYAIELALLRWVTGKTFGQVPEEPADPITDDDLPTVTFQHDEAQKYFFGRCQIYNGNERAKFSIIFCPDISVSICGWRPAVPDFHLNSHKVMYLSTHPLVLNILKFLLVHFRSDYLHLIDTEIYHDYRLAIDVYWPNCATGVREGITFNYNYNRDHHFPYLLLLVELIRVGKIKSTYFKGQVEFAGRSWDLHLEEGNELEIDAASYTYIGRGIMWHIIEKCAANK